MTVLVTGGFGLVGRSVVRELLLAGHNVRVFDTPGAGRIGRLLNRLPVSVRRRLRGLVVAASRHPQRRITGMTRPGLEVVRGDLCNIADVGEACRGVDTVVHLGAMIPPAADRHPVHADYVNRGGTENLISALERSAPRAKFIYASSVAIYGDRLKSPDIRVDDEPNPGEHDHYSRQKLAAERALRDSRLDWSIFRLTGIVSPDKLRLDPLMFDMPLATRVEWCTAEDAATALARAVYTPETSRRVFHVAGGERCRSTFGEFLDRQTEIMGLGKGCLPPQAFASEGFHCGYMETDPAERLLHFQRHSLEDYYETVERTVRWRRPLVRLFRRPIRAYLLSKSRHWSRYEQTLPATARRRVRFGWLVGGTQAHQTT